MPHNEAELGHFATPVFMKRVEGSGDHAWGIWQPESETQVAGLTYVDCTVADDVVFCDLCENR